MTNKGYRVTGKKKVIYDMALNIISVGISTVVLQLFILPSIAKHIDDASYGLMVTILAMMNTVPSTIGNVLNNVRLLNRKEKNEEDQGGDLAVLFWISETIIFVFLVIASILYLGFGDLLGIILTVFVGLVWLAAEYHSVAFRLDLDYKGVLLSNIIRSIALVIGYGLFLITKRWQVIYLFGFVGSYFYLLVIKKSRIVFEKPRRTEIFGKCLRDAASLSGANVVGRSINYADKILMYPIMGGPAVSIYYAATLLGKVVSLVITPINSVALSYLSKYKKKPDKIFRWVFLTGLGICIAGYFFAIILGKPILTFFYPDYAEEAIKYIYITSASIVIQVFTSVITPFVIKFCKTYWQVVINLITIIIYIVVSLLLVKKLGLTGFCIGVLIANIVKLIITLWTYFKHSGDDEKQGERGGDNHG